MTPEEWMQKGAALLTKAGIPDARREARMLWRHRNEAGDFLAMVSRRAQRVPMSQILGYRDFYAHRFLVTSDVLDPRPDTETLIETALEAKFDRVLDLGTGSGCILLSLLAAQPKARGVGVDISDAALHVARQNMIALRLDARTDFVLSHWFAEIEGRFDLIVANPPYIAANEIDALQPEVRLYEPRIALTDEADGLTAYRTITAGVPAHLQPGGRLIFEIGPTQADAVVAMMVQAGLERIAVIPDLDGRDRVVVGYKAGADGETPP